MEVFISNKLELNNKDSNWNKLMGFRNMQEKLEKLNIRSGLKVRETCLKQKLVSFFERMKLFDSIQKSIQVHRNVKLKIF